MKISSTHVIDQAVKKIQQKHDDHQIMGEYNPAENSVKLYIRHKKQSKVSMTLPLMESISTAFPGSKFDGYREGTAFIMEAHETLMVNLKNVKHWVLTGT